MPLTANRRALVTKEHRFTGLVNLAQGCRACPAMCGRRRVLSTANGNINSPVLFVAEAPGRRGAERTGTPLYGDQTGDNFECLLAAAGWARGDVFATNAVLCNPQDAAGRNRPPSPDELRACSFHLEMTVKVVDPAVIATLGRAALSALSLIYPHEIILGRSLATPVKWAGRTVFPLYHPSPRVMNIRSLARQADDFRALRRLADSLVKKV